MRKEEAFRKMREWAGVFGFIVVVGFVLIWGVRSTAAADRQHTQVSQAIQEAIETHGEAQTERSCADTKLLTFIIFTADERAHELKTGSYLSRGEKRRIRALTRDACEFVSTVTP
jgi:hypothetical protein